MLVHRPDVLRLLLATNDSEAAAGASHPESQLSSQVDRYLATITQHIKPHPTAHHKSDRKRTSSSADGALFSVDGDEGYKYVQKLSREQCNKVQYSVCIKSSSRGIALFFCLSHI